LSAHFGYCRNLSHRSACDSGSRLSLISEDTFQELVRNGIGIETLPVQSAVLLSSFGHTTTRSKRKMLVSFEIDGDEFENVFSELF
jgi:hypothetical protein